MNEIHTIFVPKGWTIEQTWATIQRNEPVPHRRGSWVNVEIKQNGEIGDRTDDLRRVVQEVEPELRLIAKDD